MEKPVDMEQDIRGADQDCRQEALNGGNKCCSSPGEFNIRTANQHYSLYSPDEMNSESGTDRKDLAVGFLDQ